MANEPYRMAKSEQFTFEWQQAEVEAEQADETTSYGAAASPVSAISISA